MKLYDISADNGNSWTEQWLTEQEAQDLQEKYDYLVKPSGKTVHLSPGSAGNAIH